MREYMCIDPPGAHLTELMSLLLPSDNTRSWRGFPLFTSQLTFLPHVACPVITSQWQELLLNVLKLKSRHSGATRHQARQSWAG